MDYSARPFRSVLYIPGSKERALEKARMLPADAIIFDLEDSVAPAEKVRARETLAAALTQGGYGRRSCLVRINGFESDWAEDDLAAVGATGPEAILLPKVSRAADIERIAAMLDAMPETKDTLIWAMLETCEGALNALEIASASPRMAGFVMGTNDLGKELMARSVPDRGPMITPLSLCLLAARARRLAVVDGVYNAFKDLDGLRAEAKHGRDMGFDGKTLIHPAQIEIANEVFAPSEAELELARRHIAAFEEAKAAGQGVAVVDGKIVENLHVETARKLLGRAEAVAALEEGDAA
ncbi:CoA ester lyase [Maritimibacter sp. 55A14]|uniref:HpcH/HpaI aldolase/citrate lyase family protein n=1 Tax=Maritimibacter sp. 55A14 TaxID=2174844 RepID=UPI000D612FF8|nr:CoA ester lyase [Maritimibacter sp. 55A14]PWE29258.1 CoA ester lyase [Maritimibacter sp. 55A14]